MNLFPTHARHQAGLFNRIEWMNALKISDIHEFRLEGDRWTLHHLRGLHEPLRSATRFETAVLEAAKREIERLQAMVDPPAIEQKRAGERG